MEVLGQAVGLMFKVQESSSWNCHYQLCNTPIQRPSHPLRGRSLKPRTLNLHWHSSLSTRQGFFVSCLVAWTPACSSFWNSFIHELQNVQAASVNYFVSRKLYEKLAGPKKHIILLYDVHLQRDSLQEVRSAGDVVRKTCKLCVSCP
jgi:hypothetical protein